MLTNKRTMLWRAAAIALLLALVLPLTATFAADGRAPAGYSAVNQSVSFKVITVDNAKLRTGPGTEYATITNIPFSTELTAIGRNESGAWIFLDYNGTKGWVYGELLEFSGLTFDLPVTDAAGAPESGGSQPPAAPPPPPANEPLPALVGPLTVTTKNTMNVRLSAGTAYATVTRIPANTTLQPRARSADGQWVFVESGGSKGWMAAWLTNVAGDVNSLPVSTEQGCCVAVAPASPPRPGALAGGFELGGQTHTLDNPAAMHSAGMTWVKFQHKWGPGDDPNVLTGRIQQAHANGLKVLFSIPGPEYPSSVDYQGYVRFVSGVAALGADGIEIWNEMNLDREWPAGQISPSAYVSNMLAPAYTAIKAANPGTLVISGALAPTGVDNNFSVWSDQRYVAGMRDAGAARYMDCLGVHHNAGATSPDATSGHPADNGGRHYSWYFKPTMDVYASAFPNTKLCFTELGYASGEGWGQMPPNFWWAGGNTVGEHAEWLARAVTLSRQSGRVRLLVVFNVDFTHWGDDPQAGYAIVRPGGGCPACATLAAAMK